MQLTNLQEYVHLNPRPNLTYGIIYILFTNTYGQCMYTDYHKY